MRRLCILLLLITGSALTEQGLDLGELPLQRQEVRRHGGVPELAGERALSLGRAGERDCPRVKRVDQIRVAPRLHHAVSIEGAAGDADSGAGEVAGPARFLTTILKGPL